jgi:membrane associated rhomboid family serine protease
MNFNNITPVVKNLIILNVLMFFGTMALENVNPEFVSRYLAVHYPSSEFFKPVQLVTYMFMHGSLMHIFFNMLGLFMFGPPVEYSWNPKRFLFYYFFTGFGALVLDFAVKFYQLNYTSLYPGEAEMLIDSPMVGASGALFGVLAAYGYLFPNNIIMPLFPPIPIKAKYFVLIYGAIELYSGINNMTSSTSNIAHFAHVGGALFGFLLMVYWNKGGNIGK